MNEAIRIKVFSCFFHSLYSKSPVSLSFYPLLHALQAYIIYANDDLETNILGL